VREAETAGNSPSGWLLPFVQHRKEHPVIYFIQVDEAGPIKIGYTTDLEERMACLQKQHPTPLRLLASVQGSRREERQVLLTFAADRLRGEWFRPTERLLSLIAHVVETGSLYLPEAERVKEAWKMDDHRRAGPVGIGRNRSAAKVDPERPAAVAVKEAARMLGKPPSTLYDWINRGWVETIHSENDRGRAVMVVPMSEIERLGVDLAEFGAPRNGSQLGGADQARPESVSSEPPVVTRPQAVGTSESETRPPEFVARDVPTASPAAPFPTRDDILSLIREQLREERAEKETLRRENQEACRRIGALEERLKEQIPALEAGHAATRGELVALAGRVGEIDTRSREVARRGKVTAAAAVLLALVCAVLSGLLLTGRDPEPIRPRDDPHAAQTVPEIRSQPPGDPKKRDIRLPARLPVRPENTKPKAGDE
jgi:hypothetical protein